MTSVWNFSFDFGIRNWTRPTAPVGVMHDGNHGLFAVAVTEDLSEYYDDPKKGGVRTWDISGLDYFLPFWQANPYYRQRLADMFPDGRVAYHVLRKTVALNTKLQGFLSNFTSTRFRPYMVGIHVRSRKLNNIASMRTYAMIALELGTASGVLPTDVGFYMATDNQTTKEELKNWLGQRATNLPVDFNRKNSANNPGGSDEDAALDFMSLASCDVAVTTFASSFGQWAAAMKGTPYVTIGLGLKDYDDPRRTTFWHSIRAEPCCFSVKGFVGNPEAGSYDIATVEAEHRNALANGDLKAIDDKRKHRAVSLLLASKSFYHHSQCHP
ncbi:hypothetical protein SmJEL517_g06268 [Synchytrium microbalum]|uniref:Uncharacterized protein n=1 Tax=Synchytrium microbalum TaxID=1806994 RepID=A0A507BXJ8_9FUNG|nr:uncharacterized protein SmJEL517_g06268 [Synchytrium microbalum]TPX30075.1 hypothetical protein SmJEL517_g06268 [Synchytrium microbalum]